MIDGVKALRATINAVFGVDQPFVIHDNLHAQ